MKCSVKDCDGDVDMDTAFVVSISCSAARSVFSCRLCKRLHFADGLLVTRRDGVRAFANELGIYHLNDKGEIITT